ncbi:MAG: pyridoxine 5'-phosphate synthase [Muribaculaceae bacterium]|nr:pyridoxine 5'-phosphate synthase [Muribaculaceae bacterium]
MTNLSVNINKIATLRNARGGNVPCVETVAVDCQRFGANGITVHPRPDERHITRADVHNLRPLVTTEFNIEGYPSEDFMQLVLSIVPEQVTLVPDAPGVLTSNAGWEVKEHYDQLCGIIGRLHDAGIRTSIFVGTDLDNIAWAAKTGTDRIELYTGPYAHDYAQGRDEAIAPYVAAAETARDLGLAINAGHDLSLDNLPYFKQRIGWLAEVSIGHQLISDALYLGLEKTIQAYLRCVAE